MPKHTSTVMKFRAILLGTAVFSLFMTVKAAPNRQQRSTLPECHEDHLLAYINMTESNRTVNQIKSIKAASLSECSRKCYSDAECSSLKYREADPFNCMLTNFIPTSCDHVTFVPVSKIKYDSHTLITIECLKCDSTEQLIRGEFLTPSRSNSDTESISSPESKPCVDGSDCIATWAPNGTTSLSPSFLQNLNDSVSASNDCDISTQRCPEDILFIAEKLDDTEDLSVLDQSISADSARDCAEKCLENCCERAVYLGVEKQCRFKHKGAAGTGDSECDAKDLRSYVTQYNGTDRVKITCLKCGSLSKLGRSSLPGGQSLATETNKESEEVLVGKPLEAVDGFPPGSGEQMIASVIDTPSTAVDKERALQTSHIMERACIIIFEVDPNVNLAYFRGHDNIEAVGADQCAYSCYRDACTAAVFKPSTTPGVKGICERQFGSSEKCNGTLRRDYYYKATKPVYLQCFRCLPEKPLTKAPLEATTLQPEASTVLEKQKPAPEITSQSGILVAAPGASSPTTTAKSEEKTSLAPNLVGAESEKVVTSVPGKALPTDGRSTETSGDEEESKEQTPPTESTEVSESDKSADSSAENRTKLDEQLSTPPKEVLKEKTGTELAHANINGTEPEAPLGFAIAAAPESTDKKVALSEVESTAEISTKVPVNTTVASKTTIDYESTLAETSPSVEGIAANPSTENTTAASEVVTNGEYKSTTGDAVSASETVQPTAFESSESEVREVSSLSDTTSAKYTSEYEPTTLHSVREDKSAATQSSIDESQEITTSAASVQKERAREDVSTLASEKDGSQEATVIVGNTQTNAETEAEVTSQNAGLSRTADEAEEGSAVKDSPTTEKSRVGADLYRDRSAVFSSTTLSNVGSKETILKSSEGPGSQTSAAEVEKSKETKGITEASAEMSSLPNKSHKGTVEAITKPTIEENEDTDDAPVLSSATASEDEIPRTEQLRDETITTASKNIVPRPYEFLQGCIVTFQADPYSEYPAESASGFQASTIARTTEVCAGRCYQDGCTGAKYDPNTKECVLGYSGKQICKRGPEHFFYEANETIWIHCTSCRVHKPGDKGINIMIDPLKAKAAKSSELSNELTTASNAISEIRTTGIEKPEKGSSISEEATETTATVAEISSVKSPEATFEQREKASATESGESASEKTSQAENSVAEASTIFKSSTLSSIGSSAKKEKPSEELNIDTAPAAVINEASVNKEGLTVTTAAPRTTLIGNGCVVSFQVNPIASRSNELSSELVPKGKTSTAVECAKRCYMEGCTGAKYNPADQECSLTFANHQQCNENELEYHSVEASETLWIHCISCKQEIMESTMGLLAEDTTVAVTLLNSREEEKSRGTDSATSVTKVSETAEKFLSTANLNVELKNATEPKLTAEVDDKSVDMVPKTLEENEEETASGIVVSPNTDITSLTKKVSQKFEYSSGTADSSKFTTTPGTQSTRLPLSVSEIISEEATTAGATQFDTTPIVVILKEKSSTASPTSEQVDEKEGSESVEHSKSLERVTDESKNKEFTTEAESQTTIRPEVLILMTAQTPLNVPINTPSTVTAYTEEELTKESPVKKIEVGDQKEEKYFSTVSNFHHESASTAIPKDISVETEAVATKSETLTNEESRKSTSDIVSAVANVVASIASGTTVAATEAPQAATEAPQTESTKVQEETTEESNAKITFNESAITSKEFVNETSQKATGTSQKEFVTKTSEVNTQSETTVEPIRSHEVDTSTITDIWEGTKTPETEGADAAGTLFFGSTNTVTEQSFALESVDDNLKKVVQAVSQSGVAVTEAASATVADEATKKAEEIELTDSSNIAAIGELAIEAENQGTTAAAASLSSVDFKSTNIPTTEGSTFEHSERNTVAGFSNFESLPEETARSGVADEHLTTEPPVQAVSDLVNVLSQNSKIEEVIGKASLIPNDNEEKEKEKESFAVDDASVIKDKDLERPADVAVIHSQESPSAATKENLYQGTAVGCPGRIEFEIQAVGDLPRLNVTSEVAAESPADCARRCYESTDCVLAGFVPRANSESRSAVCLLTSDVGICSAEENPISQHSSNKPLLISCLRCSKCNYTVNAVTELTRIGKAEIVEPVLSIGKCAEACSKHSCTTAQYDHKSNLCLLTSVKRQAECPQETPVEVHGNEPVLLDCVRCFT